jgi:hypothetical protein
MQLKKLNLFLSCAIATLLLAGCSEGLESHSTDADHGFVHTNRQSEVELAQPDDGESFTFAIFGDRTGTHDPVGSMKILNRAISEVNTLGPDMVLNVGDMINGINPRQEWIAQMEEFTGAMGRLSMPWFPVAGNHDVYWRSKESPKNEHEAEFEKYFAPLWYAFEHKGCWFFALYSDEGNPETGYKDSKTPASQIMSDRQKTWLKKMLIKAKDAKHIFLFQHHPRWTGGLYGDDWDNVHEILVDAGNVSAVFAGHTHVMKYNGEKDGIEYFTMGGTGANIKEDNPDRGRLHHFDLVTVRGDDFYVAAIPVGSVIDPKIKTLETVELLAKEEWEIKDDSQRLLRWPLKVTDYEGVRGQLRIRVGHNKGIHYSLLDAKGKTVSDGFLSSSSDGSWWSKRNKKEGKLMTYPVEPGEQYFFVLSDQDTKFTGKRPGNSGHINVELDVIKK